MDNALTLLTHLLSGREHKFPWGTVKIFHPGDEVPTERGILIANEVFIGIKMKLSNGDAVYFDGNDLSLQDVIKEANTLNAGTIAVINANQALTKSIQKGKIDKAKIKVDKFKNILQNRLSKPDPKHPKPKKLTKTDAQLLLDMLNGLLDNIV